MTSVPDKTEQIVDNAAQPWKEKIQQLETENSNLMQYDRRPEKEEKDTSSLILDVTQNQVSPYKLIKLRTCTVLGIRLTVDQDQGKLSPGSIVFT